MSVLSFFLAVVSLVSPVPNESRIREIAAMLPEKPSFCDPNGLMRGDMHDSAEARKLAGTQIGPFAVDLYREFAINGNRKRFETWRDRHLSALTTFVSAESSERQGRFVPQIVARLDAICSWPSWALSAHDRNMDILEGRAQRIDIVSSELARQLACVISTLGDELPTACVRRIRDEIDRRIFRPYLDSPQDQWWFLGKNNWNAVCHAGCVIAALELIDSPSTRARFVEGAERGSVVFLDYGFAADGYCSEGMGYWNYGFGNFIDLGIAVRQVTGGKVDYFRHSQAIKVMRYASAYQLERGISPLFADGAVNAKEAVVQRGLGVWPELRPEFEGVLPLRSAFPDGQVWLMRLPAGESERFALAFKGGA